MSKKYEVKYITIPDIPLIKEGDDVGRVIVDCCKKNKIVIGDKDILVVAQKIVSKAEERIVDLATVMPSKKALGLAKKSGKDPRIIELMLQESRAILKVKPGVIVTLHKLGFVCTSAGIDKGNVGNGIERVSLLPINPDKSAENIRKTIKRLLGKNAGVIISDSFGVEFRRGSIGMAIGVSGVPALVVGSNKENDLYGNNRKVKISFADEVSASASLLMGQSDEGLPVVLVRGIRYPRGNGKMLDLIETEELKNAEN